MPPIQSTASINSSLTSHRFFEVKPEEPLPPNTKCLIPGCPKTFSSNDSFKKHLTYFAKKGGNKNDLIAVRHLKLHIEWKESIGIIIIIIFLIY